MKIKDDIILNLINSINELNFNLQKLCNQSNELRFLFAKDVSRILKINVNTATNLMKSEDFPSIKIGVLKVEEQAFFEWCKQRHER